MNEMIEKAVQGTLFQAKDWLLGSLSQWLHWLVAWFFSTFGWGGLVAMVAGAVLLLSLSARAVKFFHSPRGMATSAAVMLGGLAFMWWLRPDAAPAGPAASLAANRPASMPASLALPEVAPLPMPPLLASRTEPVAAKPINRQLEIPPLFFELPPVAAVPLPPQPVAIPHIHPAIAQQTPRVTRHPAAAQPHPVVPQPPVRPIAARPGPPLAHGGQPFGGPMSAQQGNHYQGQAPGQHAGTGLSAAAQRAMMNQHLDNMMNQMMMHQLAGSGMYPMGGMHPMGGMGHSAGMHPAMGHHAGHH